MAKHNQSQTIAYVIAGTVFIILIIIISSFAWRYALSFKNESLTLKEQLEKLYSGEETFVVANVKDDKNVYLDNADATEGELKKTGDTPINGYIFSDSNTRLLTEDGLANLTPWQLKVAHNEIFARHGMAFDHEDLKCYFASQDWYSVNENYNDDLLNETEVINAETITTQEQKTTSPFAGQDSGC